jgi:hypothetical protein
VSVRRPADLTFTDPHDHKSYRVQLWDTEGLPFMINHPHPMRVVRSEEVLERQRYREEDGLRIPPGMNGFG